MIMYQLPDGTSALMRINDILDNEDPFKAIITYPEKYKFEFLGEKDISSSDSDSDKPDSLSGFIIE
jgi:hypothetical protein